MASSLSDIDAQLAALGSVPENIFELVDRHGGRGLSLQEADQALASLASTGTFERANQTKATSKTPSSSSTTAPSVAAERKSVPPSQPPPSDRPPAKRPSKAPEIYTPPRESLENLVAASSPRREQATKSRTPTRPASQQSIVAAELAASTPLDVDTSVGPLANEPSMDADDFFALAKDPHPKGSGDETVTNVFSSMTEAMVPKRRLPDPPDPEGTYSDGSVEAGSQRDADGTVTTVFASMAEALVPRRGDSMAPTHSRTSPLPPSMRPLTDQEDEQELLVDDDFEELFEGEIELIE